MNALGWALLALDRGGDRAGRVPSRKIWLTNRVRTELRRLFCCVGVSGDLNNFLQQQLRLVPPTGASHAQQGHGTHFTGDTGSVVVVVTLAAACGGDHGAPESLERFSLSSFRESWGHWSADCNAGQHAQHHGERTALQIAENARSRWRETTFRGGTRLGRKGRLTRTMESSSARGWCLFVMARQHEIWRRDRYDGNACVALGVQW